VAADAPTASPPTPPAAPRIAQDPVADLGSPDGVGVMGEAAAMPRVFVSVRASDAPDRVPRWHRHLVPEHAAVWCDLAEEDAVDALAGPDVADVLALLAEWHAQPGGHAALTGPQALVRMLHQLPFDAQHDTEARCAEFVLAHEAPPHLVLTLAEHFGWGRDFRLEGLIGTLPALDLYQCLARAREALDAQGPGSLSEVQARFARLRTSARLHASGRPLRFWLRLLLSPLAHFGDAQHAEARVMLEVDGIAGSPVLRAVTLAFWLSMLGLAAGLAWVHGPEGLFPTTHPWSLTVALMVAGAVSYVVFNDVLMFWLRGLFGPLGKRRIGRWSQQARTHRSAYWLGLVVLTLVGVAVAAGHDAYAAQIRADATVRWAMVGVSALTSGACLAFFWPRGEVWQSLVVPLWIVFAALFAQLIDLPEAWAFAFPLSAGWLLLAIMVSVCHPAVAELVFRAPFSLIRPHGARWILFFVFIKGVVAFYALVFALSPPLWVFMYARSAGRLNAWLALLAAAGLYLSGCLPLNGWSFPVWLMATLFGMSRLGRLSGWLLARRALQPA
jgi:hypothetical protein